MNERDALYMEKPDVFTTGSRVNVKYRSTHTDRDARDKSAIGYVVADEDGVLVVEEYSNYARVNEHRHVLLNTETMDVFTQTESQTRRMGQATQVVLWGPPWPSTHDTTAAGLGYLSHIREQYRMIEEGVYQYPDPAVLDPPEDWEPGADPEYVIPPKIKERNPDTALNPPFDTNI